VNTVVEPLITRDKMIETLDRSNCGIVRSRGKEASVKADEPTNRLERLGKPRKEFGEAEGPQGRASGSERVQCHIRPTERASWHNTAKPGVQFRR